MLFWNRYTSTISTTIPSCITGDKLAKTKVTIRTTSNRIAKPHKIASLRSFFRTLRTFSKKVKADFTKFQKPSAILLQKLLASGLLSSSLRVSCTLFIWHLLLFSLLGNNYAIALYSLFSLTYLWPNSSCELLFKFSVYINFSLGKSIRVCKVYSLKN